MTCIAIRLRLHFAVLFAALFFLFASSTFGPTRHSFEVEDARAGAG
jgi:hypothetical protein